jgi:hypothetical protein
MSGPPRRGRHSEGTMIDELIHDGEAAMERIQRLRGYL